MLGPDCHDPLPWTERGQAGAESAGRKAATLARLRAAGFPVPDGFVIPAGATVLDDGLTDAILKAHLGGGPFAVRSSGLDEDGEHASHAGQYTTVLEQDCRATLSTALCGNARCAWRTTPSQEQP